MGIFEIAMLIKLCFWLVMIAAGLYIVKTVVAFVTGGVIGYKASKLLNKEDREWHRPTPSETVN
jgi:hypothetical protein